MKREVQRRKKSRGRFSCLKMGKFVKNKCDHTHQEEQQLCEGRRLAELREGHPTVVDERVVSLLDAI